MPLSKTLHQRYKKAYLFRRFKSWDSEHYPLPKSSGSLTTFFTQFFSDFLELIDTTGDAPPGLVLQDWIALAVQSEVRIILPLDEPVSPLITVTTPRLDRKRLVQIIVMSLLLVRFFDDC